MTTQEQKARERDEFAQESGPADARAPRTARDFTHAVRPDGLDVVFLPGELLPDWYVEPEETPRRARKAARSDG